MKLWVLSAKIDVVPGGFDAFIIEAPDEKTARILAQEQGQAECESAGKRYRFWEDRELTLCEEIEVTGQYGVVLGNIKDS